MYAQLRSRKIFVCPKKSKKGPKWTQNRFVFSWEYPKMKEVTILSFPVQTLIFIINISEKNG